MTWRGTYPNTPDLPVRIEVAAYHGKPSYFEIINPWGSHAPQAPVPPTDTRTAGFLVLLVVFFGIMVVGGLLAFKNIRLGRGDLKGAFRVTVFLFILRMVSWAASVHHVPRIGEVDLLIAGLQSALFWSCFAGLMYLALEPFLRSRWPDRIISWSRLLAGDFRDPLVGRDILIGALFGVGLILNLQLFQVVPRWLGWPPGIPILLAIPEMGMLGIRSFLPLFAIQMSAPLVQSFMVVFLLLFLAMLLRKNWLGIGAGWLVLSGFIVSGVADEGLLVAAVAFGFVTSTLLVFVAVRFGLLALMSALVFWVLPHFFPMTTELTAWYAGDFILDLTLLVGIAVYGFYIALAGQPLFRGRVARGMKALSALYSPVPFGSRLGNYFQQLAFRVLGVKRRPAGLDLAVGTDPTAGRSPWLSRDLGMASLTRKHSRSPTMPVQAWIRRSGQEPKTRRPSYGRFFEAHRHKHSSIKSFCSLSDIVAHFFSS